MKFNRNFDEDYDTGVKKQKPSYTKNNRVELSDQEVKEKAEALVNATVDNRTVFGYKASNGEKVYCVKYDKSNDVCVEYDLKGNVLSSKQISIRDYNSKKVVSYEDEI